MSRATTKGRTIATLALWSLSAGLVGGDDGTGQISFEAGLEAYDAGAPATAAEHFLEALESAPDDPRAHFWLGKSYAAEVTHAGLVERAVLARKIKAAFDRAVALDPEYMEARFGLLRFYLTAPRLLGGSTERAWEEAREIANRDSRMGFRAWSTIHESSASWAEAESLYRRASAEAPDEAEPYLRLTWLLQRQDRFEEAFEVLDRFREAIPENRQALFEVGRTAAFSGLYPARGRVALTTFLEGEPAPTTRDRALAHYHLGTIHRHERRDDLAMERFRAALALDGALDAAARSMAELESYLPVPALDT